MRPEADHRILSRPVKLHWAGWETDTHRLQQAGWQLSAEQDICRQSMRLAIQHERYGARGMSEIAEHRYRSLDPYDRAPFETSLNMRMGRDVLLQNFGATDFQAIDAQPQFTSEAPRRLEDFAHFAPQLTRTAQLLVPEESVDELLARILEKQQAAKTAYFREQVAREGAHALPQHRFAAQIIAFREAA